MKLKKLFNLYITFTINRLLLMFLASAIIILCFYLLFIINNNYSDDSYLLNSDIYHQNYIKQSLLMIYIINSVIIFLLTYILNINALGYDILFIPANSRIKIGLAKILVYIIIFIFLILIEYELMIGIGIYKYQFFKIDNYYHILYELFIATTFECGISMMLSVMLSHIVIPIFVLLSSIIFKILLNNSETIINKIKDFIPIILENNKNNVGMFFGIIWTFLLFMVYLGVYFVKDIKSM